MEKFGKTYWGQQFLKALENIDFSNRLPRGRRYASNGSVKSITIKENKIQARVQGTRPSPYKIEIIIPLFTPAQKTDLLEALKANPALLASLLNRRLPEEMLNIATQKKVPIFPRQWKDFGMSCSCPDWAVPCKHLAAVVYLIANEIDLNPFKVLELHGLDVIRELSGQGMEVEESAIEKLESWDGFFVKKPNSLKAPDSLDGLNELDFSVIPRYDDRFLTLLSPNPPFCEKDFKGLLLPLFRYATKSIGRHNFLPPGAAAPPLDIHQCLNASILLLDHASRFEVELEFEDSYDRISFPALFQLFNDSENFQPSRVSAPVYLLYHFFLFSKKIIEQGALLPQIVTHGDTCRIVWQPLLKDGSVKLQMDVLNQFASFVPVAHLNGKSKSWFAGKEHFAFLVSSICITLMMENIVRYSSKIDQGEALLFLFFGKPYKFERKGQEFLNAIQLWLNKITIHKRQFVPVFEIVDDYPKYAVGLHIKASGGGRLEAPVPFHLFKKKNKDKILAVTKDLLHFQEHFPELTPVLNSNERRLIEYEPQGFADFLLRISPVLSLLGVEILLPKSMKSIIKPAPSIRVTTKGSKEARKYLDLLSILDFEWKVAIGDTLMSEADFLKLVKGMSGIIKIRESYIHLSREDLDKLLKHIQGDQKLSRHQLLQALFASEYQGEKIELSEELKGLLEQFSKKEPVPLPRGLQGQLRPYQQRGYEWLYKNSKIGMGSILADDMGLGKTYQTITALLKFKEEQLLKKNKVLIIVPTTLLSNWGKELQKFAPGLDYGIYHGPRRDLKAFQKMDIILTSYGTARTDAGLLNKQKWEVLIIDEAQNIKNPSTDQTKAIKTINSNIRIALSGTPVENRLSEYWSIFDFTNKGYLGSLKHFNDEFSRPIMLERNHHQLEVFRKITAPFIMRRMKTDKSIISDLPDKIENNQYCQLSQQQAALYENTVNDAMLSIETSDGIERKGLVLKMMTALKQIGNHPFQYLKTGACSPDHSGKWLALSGLLQAIIENGEKTLLFTQYKEMGDILQELIRHELKTEALFLHGGLSLQERTRLVDEFQTKAHRKVFILSLKAGGTGLNLTQAQNVIHYDLWWNPAVETQATDRAYRIGQKNKVIVHRLINQGTLEERIDEMIRDKKELADLAVSSGEKWLGELSNQELKELVKLTREP